MQHAASGQFHAATSRRHYGMDWLRIGAFGLLILYHIGMVFAPWAWIVKAPETHDALIAPMALLTPWRLALLFAVSGYASRKLFDRSPGTGAFLAARSRRLLVPLAFAMVVLIPVEMWVRVRVAGYQGGYLAFWAHDYWRSGTFHGVAFPSWQHLWFVVYLWVYTLGLGTVLAAGAAFGQRLAAWFDEGPRLLWVPAAALVTLRLALLFVVPENHGLFTDWAGHAEYVPMFAFGFMLAGHPALWGAVTRAARPALALALAAGAVAVAIEVNYPARAVPPHGLMALDRAAMVTMGWAMVLVLFHAAHRWLDRDHRWRASLAEAVFPAYLIHEPAIALVVWWTLPLGLGAFAQFALLVATTATACAGFYLIGRRIGWLRPLIGLSPRPAAPTAAKARAVA